MMDVFYLGPLRLGAVRFYKKRNDGNKQRIAIDAKLVRRRGTLGGVVSMVVNRKENRRIKRSEAARSEAAAKKEDATAASEMMGLLERTVAHTELLQLQRVEDHRRITGMEKMLEQELAWRRDSDYHYCEVKDCQERKPPMGTFKR